MLSHAIRCRATSRWTFFNLAHHLHDATNRESTPVFALVHTKHAAPGYGDWLALSELAPVFGEWHGVDKLLTDSHSAEYISVPGADEFFVDSLDDRVTRRQLSAPWSARFAKRAGPPARKLDSAFALAAICTVNLTPLPGERRPCDGEAARRNSKMALESGGDATKLVAFNGSDSGPRSSPSDCSPVPSRTAPAGWC